MSTPWKHAENSAAKFGGEPSDYIIVHNWFDETKQYTGDWTHRALRHHAAGIEWCIERWGHVLYRVSDGKTVPMKLVAEQHVMEDCCGRIPTIQDWLSVLAKNPPQWMLRVQKTTTETMEVVQ